MNDFKRILNTVKDCLIMERPMEFWDKMQNLAHSLSPLSLYEHDYSSRL